MGHPQSSPRGLFAKQRIDIQDEQITQNSTGLVLNQGITISNQANAALTGDSTGLVVAGGVKVSNQANAVVTGDSTGLILVGDLQINALRRITADSTGYVLTAEAALPGSVDGGDQFTMISNSTGVALAVNSTGTTWKYLNVTVAQPT